MKLFSRLVMSVCLLNLLPAPSALGTVLVTDGAERERLVDEGEGLILPPPPGEAPEGGRNIFRPPLDGKDALAKLRRDYGPFERPAAGNPPGLKTSKGAFKLGDTLPVVVGGKAFSFVLDEVVEKGFWLRLKDERHFIEFPPPPPPPGDSEPTVEGALAQLEKENRFRGLLRRGDSYFLQSVDGVLQVGDAVKVTMKQSKPKEDKAFVFELESISATGCVLRHGEQTFPFGWENGALKLR
jgi:hypothetical protein